MSRKKFDPNSLPEVDLEIPELKKKLTVRTQNSPLGLTEAFAFVAGLIARDELQDTEAGLNPKSPTHTVTHDADGKYRLKRLRFNAF